uniref:Uncharacterized protein n=1 Tax=Glossina palpalis gambiensis TaxID=67801 RepID=A0A1B0AT27_9MUSC
MFMTMLYRCHDMQENQFHITLSAMVVVEKLSVEDNFFNDPTSITNEEAILLLLLLHCTGFALPALVQIKF